MADILPLCPSCSTPLPAGALFCTICGVATPTSLGGSDPALAAAPTQQLSEDDEAERVYHDRLQRALGNAYVLGERIGRGGFGAVYRVRDVRLKRDVAVKVLRSDLMESRQMEVRFLREAEAVAQLRHPNIIPIYGVGEGDGLIYFIMPLVQGESLLARLQREGPLPIPEVRRILADVASALTVAHKAGIVHRDLKPENIMLEGDARHVLLMDFGIAKTLGAGGAGGAGALTSQGMILGTPYYMSPEQAMGAAELDGRSDVYSLGVVGFQMLTGRVPFHGESVQSVLLMHISAPPPEIQSLRPDTPPALSKLVMRCLAKRPQERWSSSAELAGALSGASPPASISSWRLPRPAWLTARRAGIGAAAVVAIAAGTFAVARLRGRAAESRPGHTPWEDLGVTIPYDTLAYRLDRPHWLASLADTLLIVPFDSIGELWAFSGDSLHVLHGTKGSADNPPYVVVRDTAWSANQYGIDYLGVHGSVAIADMPGDVAVLSTWSDGRDLIVGRADGSIVRRIAHGWRREATGTRHAIRAMFGRDTLHQYALADVADAHVTDSLFIYDGLGWSARDVRPDTAVRTRYVGGRAFADGATVLVGSACSASGACRPLAIRQDSTAGVWHDIPLAISTSVRLSGVWGTSSGDFYAWGIDTIGETPVGCGGGGPCLWHVTRRGVEPVTALGPTRVLGMAGLRGAPYVLLEDGTLRSPRGNAWPVAARLPSVALVAVAPLAGAGPVV
ncbi:MAG TPA: serine/threonine-protein kinase, partial [Gemmatimonadales bacterium]|nr:serine/threonine-protein kinase [Gemmatimonadales bacterium]